MTKPIKKVANIMKMQEFRRKCMKTHHIHGVYENLLRDIGQCFDRFKQFYISLLHTSISDKVIRYDPCKPLVSLGN